MTKKVPSNIIADIFNQLRLFRRKSHLRIDRPVRTSVWGGGEEAVSDIKSCFKISDTKNTILYKKYQMLNEFPGYMAATSQDDL